MINNNFQMTFTPIDPKCRAGKSLIPFYEDLRITDEEVRKIVIEEPERCDQTIDMFDDAIE